MRSRCNIFPNLNVRQHITLNYCAFCSRISSRRTLELRFTMNNNDSFIVGRHQFKNRSTIETLDAITMELDATAVPPMPSKEDPKAGPLAALRWVRPYDCLAEPDIAVFSTFAGIPEPGSPG